MKISTPILNLILIGLSGTGMAPIIDQNPSNVIAVADFPQVGLLVPARGYVIFSSLEGGKVDVHVDMTGLPFKASPFRYLIHENPVPPDGNCNGTGLHFNPYQAQFRCDLQLNNSYCQLGDLSGKHGMINSTCIDTKYQDEYLSLDPQLPSNIVGRSIVFHYPDSSRFACATIEIAREDQMAQMREYGILPGQAKAKLSLASNLTNKTTHGNSSEATGFRVRSSVVVALSVVLAALL